MQRKCRVAGTQVSGFRNALTAGLVFGAVAGLFPALAQEYLISTVAGGSPPPTPSAATSVAIDSPAGMAVDRQGNIFFSSNNCIFKVDRDGILTRVAGSSRAAFSGDGGPALEAQLDRPESIAVDGSGTIYFVDAGNYRIRRISPQGVITTFAGTGLWASGNPPKEGAAASATHLGLVQSLAVDRSGTLYYLDVSSSGYRVRKIPQSGLITTVAGGGDAAPDDGSTATSVRLQEVNHLAIDDHGAFFLSFGSRVETGPHVIRKVDAAGVISTVAGTGAKGSSGDGGAALQARLNAPGAMVADDAGNLFFADHDNYRVRKVSSGGTISTIAGGGRDFPGDGRKATDITFCNDPRCLSALALDDDGNLYIAACYVAKVGRDGILSILSGNGLYSIGGDGGPATSAQFFGPNSLARDHQGNLYIADSGNNRVRMVTPDGKIQTIAGTGAYGFAGDGGPAVDAVLNNPVSVAVDSQGNVYIADVLNLRIRRVSPEGRISTFAGTGSQDFSPDGTPAGHAGVWPSALLVDHQDNLLFIDRGSLIRKFDGECKLTTIAGNGDSGFSGDGGPATDANFYLPSSLAIDSNDNLLIADTFNGRIRRVSPDGIISTIAGVGGNSYNWDPLDGRPATEAVVFWPESVAAGENGDIFISATGGLRRITPDGIINTIAREPFSPKSTGDGGPGSLAYLSPGALTMGEGGRIYVIDTAPATNGPRRPVGSSVRLLEPIGEAVILTSILDAATQSARPISPGKLVILRGVGMGPAQTLRNEPVSGPLGTDFAGTEVRINGISAPIVFTSTGEVSIIVPDSIEGPSAEVTAAYQGRFSQPLSVAVAPASPAIFSANGTGGGQAAALNPDGSSNDAEHPCWPGETVTLSITGVGRSPLDDYALSATVGGLNAAVTLAVKSPGPAPGVLRVVVMIPPAVTPGGYVPVEIQVGGASSPAGATWIAVASPNPD